MIELCETHGVLTIQGTRFLFDPDDLWIIKSRTWYKDKDGYLASNYLFNGKLCFLMFHREVIKAPAGSVVDHINRDKCDNRKCNLRLCSRSENNMNRNRFANNTSGVAGVYYEAGRDRWVANIVCRHQRVYIGRYKTKEEAIVARLAKEAELFGEFSAQASHNDKMIGVTANAKEVLHL